MPAVLCVVTAGWAVASVDLLQYDEPGSLWASVGSHPCVCTEALFWPGGSLSEAEAGECAICSSDLFAELSDTSLRGGIFCLLDAAEMTLYAGFFVCNLVASDAESLNVVGVFLVEALYGRLAVCEDQYLI